MPTTIRLLIRLTGVAVLFWIAVYVLATYVEPTPEPVSVRISTERFE